MQGKIMQSVIHKDTYRYIQIHTDTYRYIQIYTDTYRYIQIHTDIYRYIQIHTDTIQIHFQLESVVQDKTVQSAWLDPSQLFLRREAFQSTRQII